MSGYPISCFWAGPISELEILCLKSFVGHGHPVHLYSYEDISGLPAGVILMDANEIIEGGPVVYDGPMPKTATKSAFALMPFSDRFRFTLLRMNGGLWLDLDIILVRSIPDELFELDFWCSSERTMQKGAYRSAVPFKANIGALYVSEPEHPLMVELTTKTKPTRSAWDGLKHFQRALTRLDLGKGVLQPSAFCDGDWFSIKQFNVTMCDTERFPTKWGVIGASVIPPPEAIGIHTWRGLLRKHGIKYGKADLSPLSYLGRLYRQAEEVYDEFYRVTGGGSTDAITGTITGEG